MRKATREVSSTDILQNKGLARSKPVELFIIYSSGRKRGAFETPPFVLVFGFLGSDIYRSALGFDVDPSDVFADKSECHQNQSADEEDEAEE